MGPVCRGAPGWAVRVGTPISSSRVWATSLIVSENGSAANPNDARDGVLTFDFRGFGPGVVTVESFVLADTTRGVPT